MARSSILIASLFAVLLIGGVRLDAACADYRIRASAVRSASDVQAFVECAKDYLEEHGADEARRAFNEDERWMDGSTYVFVNAISRSGADQLFFVYPPDPSREGMPWGESIDDFGTDLAAEAYRVMEVVNAGWIYYSFTNPATGTRQPKATYIAEVDWKGHRANIGAGIYSADWPGSCSPDDVSAARLDAGPSDDGLRQLVRCASMVLADRGFFAREELESSRRWRHGSAYVFVLDMLGNQIMSGGPRIGPGRVPHELGPRHAFRDQFGGRDMTGTVDTFGEAYLYYRALNPATGANEPKVGFLKRVVVRGVPLIVGSGYYPGSVAVAGPPGCDEKSVAASAVRTSDDIQSLVQCAAEYLERHGQDEAYRAFHEDDRWRHGQIYLFVNSTGLTGQDSLVHVFPPDRNREVAWGPTVDRFGTDVFPNQHRILSLVPEAWHYYAFTNPSTGLDEPKRSYVKSIEWNGDRAVLGAGFYAADLPGTCHSAQVSAAALGAGPSDEGLQQFVRCAAHMVESSGYFAGPVLTEGDRWNHGSIYVYGISVNTGAVQFSGNPASVQLSGMLPELFGGRDMVEAAETFGEVFLYYNVLDPATGAVRPTVGFARVVPGLPVLVGSGYNP